MMQRKIKKTQLKGLVFMCSLLLILVNACNNEIEQDNVVFEDGETAAFESENDAEMYFNIVESFGTAAITELESNSGGRKETPTSPEFHCAEVAWNYENRRVVIDFGDGCKGLDGRTRKGKVVIEYSNYELAVEAEFVTVLNNFYIDGIKIEGTRTMVIESLSDEEISYTEELEDGKIIWPNETFITRESEGLRTLTYSDLSLKIEGEASGTSKLGVSYTSEIKDPLLFKSDCLEYRLPVSGSTIITIEELPLITVDFGNGDCDDSFTVSIEERSKEMSVE